MADWHVVMNSRGVRDLLQSEGVQRDLKRRADAVAEQAGPGHRVEVNLTKERARAVVVTDTFEAAAAEARDRNLTRAIDAARR